MNRILILAACMLTTLLATNPVQAGGFPLPPPPPLAILLPPPPPFAIFIGERQHRDYDRRHEAWRDRHDQRWERRAYRNELRHQRHDDRCKVCSTWPPDRREWRQHRHDRDARGDDHGDRRHFRESRRDRYDR